MISFKPSIGVLVYGWVCLVSFDLVLLWRINRPSFLFRFLTIKDLASLDEFLELVVILPLLANGTNGSKVSAVGLINLVLGESCFSFKVVNILSKIMADLVLIVKHFAEMVGWSCLELVKT